MNGDLEEEIYMKIPPGFGNDLTTKKVCKSKKALYGLKQSPRVWFGRFAKVMENMRYKVREIIHCLSSIQIQGSHNSFGICRRHHHDGK